MSAKLDVTPIFGEVIHTFDEESGLIFPKIWDGSRWQNVYSDNTMEIMKKIAAEGPEDWKPFMPVED